MQGFVGYVDGAAVAAAALYLTHGVAGIGWVGCVPAARGRRYAEAVTWARRARGLPARGQLRQPAGLADGPPGLRAHGLRTPTEYRVLFAQS